MTRWARSTFMRRQGVHGVGQHFFGDAAHFRNMAVERFEIGVERADGMIDHCQNPVEAEFRISRNGR